MLWNFFFYYLFGKSRVCQVYFISFSPDFSWLALLVCLLSALCIYPIQVHVPEPENPFSISPVSFPLPHPFEREKPAKVRDETQHAAIALSEREKGLKKKK